MNDLTWTATVRLVQRRADFRCEYCQTRQDVIGQALHVDHIDPTGGDDPGNLCLACPSCNLSKAQATTAPDPETGQTVALFNPRLQQWADHFAWVDAGRRVEGFTPEGRATVIRLRMNLDRLVVARAFWVRAGLHPPQD
jgi:hypothetical protein